MNLFSVIETPELYVNRARAEKLAGTVREWGYRGRVWVKQDRNEPTDYGFCVAVYSNNGFEGYAHAL
ncbi:hypothetical protein UFOVP149_40 [uncultured Caudovirales phage]|uniref:Uncharacterized protein n=1 Tax=uncultured Caudovirales phage TaxID=2100421 RepID=A0A6J7WCE9_9CAUD|nr:hypothetical protein UFOVP149_40 [uncultured Caudovirales phage]